MARLLDDDRNMLFVIFTAADLASGNGSKLDPDALVASNMKRAESAMKIMQERQESNSRGRDRSPRSRKHQRTG